MSASGNILKDARAREGTGGGRRARLARVLRFAPALAALTLWVAFVGACGRSIYPFASDTPTPTPTITTSPTTGNFLYSSNFGDGKVAEFIRNLSTGALTRKGAAAAGSVKGPIGIANGPSAKFLYVTNSANDNVRQFKINSTTGALTAIGGSPIAAGKSPQWVAVTPNATFAYVTNSGDGTITEYTVDAKNGALSANGSFSSTKLKTPAAAVASNSWLYVTDSTNGTIVSFPINTDGTLGAGTITVLSGSVKPGPVILDPSGSFVYVTDQSIGRVYFLTVGTGVLTFVTAYQPSGAGESGLAIATTNTTVTPNVEFLYVANQLSGTPSITAFQINGDGSLGLPLTPVTDASLNLPTGLVVDPTNTYLYVANQGTGTITQFTIDPVTGALSNAVFVNTESATSKPLYLAIGE